MVTFTGISVEDKGHRLQLAGFWHGGKEWWVTFAAPASGTSEYVSVSKGRKLNGKKGKIEVKEWNPAEREVNLPRHGFIRVKQTGENDGRLFEMPTESHFYRWVIPGGIGQNGAFTSKLLKRWWTTA